jgi:pimeloyl-ACP methyl ester carboxylesterase
MRRRLLLCGVFLAAVVPWLAGPVAAQTDDPTVVPMTFRTSDHATISGVLNKPTKAGVAPGRSPVVILLHGSGDDPAKGDYPALAKTLADRGFNVLRFDFRGHGKSTGVANDFWTDPINANYLKTLAKKKPIKTKIEWNDLKVGKNGGYFPRLADDLMAARASLDQLNDNGEVSTSSVYLVGARDAATIGLLYLAAEWSRPQKLPPTIINRFPPLAPRNQQTILGVGDPCAGWDVAGAVWLSAVRHPSVSQPTMQAWVQSAPEMRERTPMLFLYGEKDVKAKSEAKAFREEVLVAQPRTGAPPLPLTIARPIEKTDLSGVGLLKDPSTEKIIVEYLEAREKDRKSLLRVPNRGYAPPPPSINLPLFGVCR